MEIIKHCRRDRVLLLIKDRFEGNKAAFAKAIGRPAPNVHRMLAIGSGKDQRGIGEDLARDIEKSLSLPHLWLDQPTETGISSLAKIRPLQSPRPDPETHISLTNPPSNVTVAMPVGKMIPLISWVQAGLFCGSPDLFHPGDCEEQIPCPKKVGPHTYALRVKGDSMVSDNPGEKSYPEGTIIYVDPDRVVTNGCKVVVRVHDAEEATFKKFSEDAGRRYLRPLNKAFPTIPMDDSMHICGVVVGSWIDE